MRTPRFIIGYPIAWLIFLIVSPLWITLDIIDTINEKRKIHSTKR